MLFGYCQIACEKHAIAFNFRYDHGETPLHWIFTSRLGARAEYAAKMAQDCVKIVKLLIANGVDLNAKLENGKTPLHFTASSCPPLTHLFT